VRLYKLQKRRGKAMANVMQKVKGFVANHKISAVLVGLTPMLSMTANAAANEVVSTAASTAAADITATIADVAPEAIGVGVGILAITFGWKFFRRLLGR
jgi:hypothetical protein